MALDPDEAARIAHEAGLGIGDAVALRMLTDDPATAERIACKFGQSDNRDVVRSLFQPDAAGRVRQGLDTVRGVVRLPSPTQETAS